MPYAVVGMVGIIQKKMREDVGMMKRIRSIFKRLSSPRSKNYCILTLLALLVATLFVNYGPFQATGPLDDDTTQTTTTTTTTTTPEPDLDQYIIRFQYVWGPDIPEEDKCNLEFFAYDTDGTTLRDKAAFSKNAVNVWYPGELGEIFIEGEQIEIQMESYQTWHDMVEWVTITVGPTSHSITFYSYKYGFSAFMDSELRINWELI